MYQNWKMTAPKPLPLIPPTEKKSEPPKFDIPATAKPPPSQPPRRSLRPKQLLELKPESDTENEDYRDLELALTEGTSNKKSDKIKFLKNITRFKKKTNSKIRKIWNWNRNLPGLKKD